MLSFSEMGIPWSGPRSRWPLRPRGAKSSASAFLALAEFDAAIFEGEAAAFAVVTDLHKLILQGAIGDVVADAGDYVETATRFAAVAGEHANLIGKRLQDGIGLQAKMGNGGKEFAIGLDLQQCADDGDLA